MVDMARAGLNLGSGRKGSVPDPAKRMPIHERILPRIRKDIILNRWQPGERLPETDLCTEFGISRTPLRDAFKILEVEGFVALTPHVGAIVTPLTARDVMEKFEVMSGLEQMAAMKVARSQAPETLALVKRIHRGMKRSAKEGNATQYYRQNDEFHRAIVMGAGNLTLVQMHQNLMLHVSRARNLMHMYEPLSEAAFEHHSEIVRAILAGDGDAARRAMEDHLGQVAALMLHHVRSENDATLPAGVPAAGMRARTE
jgi:DNA-binding GntR family transcriptional regulator